MAVPTEILELMQKLKNMTIDHGCTPAEAENAAARLHSMLQKHQVSISDLNTSTISEDVEQLTLETEGGRRWGYGVVEFATQIADAFDCQLIYSKTKLTFIGIESDVRVSSFFFDQTHLKVLMAGKREAKRTCRVGVELSHYAQNFLSGAGVAIRSRLKRQTEDILRYGDSPVCCSALVPVKQQKVGEFMEKHWPQCRTVPARKLRDGAVDGWEFGNQMELQRGLDGAKAGQAAALEGGAR